MSDNPWWLDNALVDVSKLPKRFPDEGPLLPGDPQSPVKEAMLGSVFGVLPWLNDPDKPGTRMQLWPERMARSALTLPSDVVSGRVPIYDPETGHVNPEVIERVQDMSGLIMSGTLFGAPRGSLGTGPARPPAAAEPRAPTFFTGLERELLSTKRGENAAPESGTMADWQEYLGKRVKPDEVKWLLRPDAVADPKQRFSRQEIAERVAANKPQEHWKSQLDEEDTQLERVDTIADQWSKNPPVFTTEPVAAGYSNIIDQHGNIIKRHVSNMKTKGDIMDLEEIVRDYKKSLEPLSPEASANAASKRYQASELYEELIDGVAYNYKPESNAVYGPKDYPEYTLPGGENYRELVVTQPDPAYNPQVIRDYTQLDNDIVAIKRELSNVGNQWQTARGKVQRLREEISRGTSRMEAPAELQQAEREVNRAQSRRDQIADQIPKLEKEQQEMEPAYQRSVEAGNSRYQSSHWEEKNALAHARMTDRDIPGTGKTLNIEEVQSDWHQAGQKNKYIGDPSLVKYEQVRSALDLQAEIGESLDKLVHSKQPDISETSAKNLVTDLLQATQRDYRGENLSSFYSPEELKLAQQWIEAGEHYQRLKEQYQDQKAVPDAPFKATWPDMMLKRLLRKAIDEGYDAISWVPGAEHARRYQQEVRGSEIGWHPEDGSNKVMVRTPADRQWTAIGEASTPEELVKVVGKDVADQLLEPGHYVKLDEPQIFYTQRGRRMQSFYDKQLVDKMNAIVGKYGAKVEKADLPGARTPENRNLAPGHDNIIIVHAEDGTISVENSRTNQVYGNNLTQAEADKLANRLRVKPQEVFVVKLNDKMRRDVQSKGFPLFSGGLISVDHNPFDYDWNKSAAADLTRRTIMRGDWQPQKMTGDEWMRSLQNNSVPGSNRQ